MTVFFSENGPNPTTQRAVPLKLRKLRNSEAKNRKLHKISTHGGADQNPDASKGH